MNTPTPAQFDTSEIKNLVCSLLKAKAIKDVLTENVAEIYKDILEDYEILVDQEERSFRRQHSDLRLSNRILNHDDLYLAGDEDDELIAGIYALAKHVIDQRGLRPDDVPYDHCPALSADTLVIQVENELLKISGDIMNLDVQNLSVIKRDKWLDLVIKLVTSLPSFKYPAINFNSFSV